MNSDKCEFTGLLRRAQLDAVLLTDEQWATLEAHLSAEPVCAFCARDIEFYKSVLLQPLSQESGGGSQSRDGDASTPLLSGLRLVPRRVAAKSAGGASEAAQRSSRRAHSYSFPQLQCGELVLHFSADRSGAIGLAVVPDGQYRIVMLGNDRYQLAR